MDTDDKATPARDALQLLRVAESLGSGAEFHVDDVNALTRHIDSLAAALAAERARADRAEARLAIVWDEGYDASSTDWDNGGPGDPNPYHSEATA